MGCNCGGGTKTTRGAARGTVTLHQVRYQDGTVRNYLTEGEALAAVRASLRTGNQAVYDPPSLIS